MNQVLRTGKTVLSNLNMGKILFLKNFFFDSDLLYGVFTSLQRVTTIDFITTPKLNTGIIPVLNI